MPEGRGTRQKSIRHEIQAKGKTGDTGKGLQVSRLRTKVIIATGHFANRQNQKAEHSVQATASPLAYQCTKFATGGTKVMASTCTNKSQSCTMQLESSV